MTRMRTQTKAAANTTAELSDEHRIILKVVAALRAECGKVAGGAAVDPQFFLKAVDFIRNYADKFHHAKEEDILFPALDEPGVRMPCDPRPVMLENHELGRLYVRGLEGALREGRKAELLENTRGYCGLLEEHIYKEDNILYPMADEALGAARGAALKERFAAVDREFAAVVKAQLAFAASVGA
ncbi:MAG: hemerythrin domain-containing protein [Elusimicrobia bacterium]|nr:hemerythrin domain-containing protein [Elusimicrobiota bacterium]